jgi:pimeloyl-ACP methyl ester carboxylesterase
MKPRPLDLLRFGTLRLAFQAARALSPDLAHRWAERLFCTPRRHRVPAVEAAALRLGRSFPFASRGLRLRACVWGEGPAVLCLHGWEGRASQFHAFIGPLTEAGFSLVAFDQPGHGESPGRRGGPLDWSYAIQDLVREIGPIHGLVTHSLGAAGAALAMDRGLAAPRAVMIAPPSEPDPYYAGLLTRLGLPEANHPAAFRAYADRLGLPWERLRLRTLAADLSGPLLVIHDQEDRDVPLSSGAAVASAWPGAQLSTTQGLGHRRILRDPGVVRQAVDFLRNVPASVLVPIQGEGPRSLEWHLFHRELRSA